MMKTRAAVLRKGGEPWEIAELDLDEPKAGEVLIRVTITATPQACADCLVPKDLMRGILGQAFGVPPDTIDLTYPSTPDTYPSTSEQER